MGFYEAWQFLLNHSVFQKSYLERLSWFGSTALDIDVVKVNPKNRRIEKDDLKNTKIEVWLECCVYGEYDGDYSGELDHNLDCGADTFEKAIIKLAKLVQKHYGDGTYTKEENEKYDKECKKCYREIKRWATVPEDK